MDKEKLKGEIEGLATQLCDELKKGNSAKLEQYLAFAGKFHKYSFGNVMAIAWQMPHATHVAGYGRWKQLGRQVKAGERGIAITAPCTRKVVDKKTGEEKFIVAGFRLAFVFDVSQTTGDPVPEIWDVSGDPGDLEERLKEVIQGKGIELVMEDEPNARLGVSEKGTIRIAGGLDAGLRAHVLIHELAHELLHTEGRDKTTTTSRELEAESVAAIVGARFGLRAGQSPDYIRLWGGDESLFMKLLNRIVRVAGEIIEAVEEAGLAVA